MSPAGKISMSFLPPESILIPVWQTPNRSVSKKHAGHPYMDDSVLFINMWISGAQCAEYALIDSNNILAVTFDIVGGEIQVFLMLLFDKMNDVSCTHARFQRGEFNTKSLAALEILPQTQLQKLFIITVVFQ